LKVSSTSEKNEMNTIIFLNIALAFSQKDFGFFLQGILSLISNSLWMWIIYLYTQTFLCAHGEILGHKAAIGKSSFISLYVHGVGAISTCRTKLSYMVQLSANDPLIN